MALGVLALVIIALGVPLGPGSAAASNWYQSPISEIQDVAYGPSGLWVVKHDETIWRSLDDGQTFAQIDAEGFERVAVANDGTLWAVGANGTLWNYLDGEWAQTPASGMGDVAVAPNGDVWLAGRNGTIWFTRDRGRTFTRIDATGFRRLSVDPEGAVWAVKTDRSLWVRRNGAWTHFGADAYEDVAAGGIVWLTAADGSIRTFSGGAFGRDPDASGFKSIALGRNRVWAVGASGTLWKQVLVHLN